MTFLELSQSINRHCKHLDCRIGMLGRWPLRDPAGVSFFRAKLMLPWRPSHPARVKLEVSVDHDDGSWMISGLITHISQCVRSSYKEAVAQIRFDLERPNCRGYLDRS